MGDVRKTFCQNAVSILKPDTSNLRVNGSLTLVKMTASRRKFRRDAVIFRVKQQVTAAARRSCGSTFQKDPALLSRTAGTYTASLQEQASVQVPGRIP